MRVRGAWRVAAAIVAMAALAGPAGAEAAPHAVIDSGPPERTKETSADFAFRASEQPVLGIGGQPTFECRLDAGPWEGCTSPKSYTGLLGGSHAFEVRDTGLL